MEWIIYGLTAIGSFLISIIVHEAGHGLAGLMNGFKISLFVVGPLGFKRDEKDQLHFYIEKNLSYWGGLCGVIPQNENADNFNRFARVIIAGPIASLLVGGLVMTLWHFTQFNTLLMLGSMLVAISGVSLVPMRNGAFFTDGGRWLRMCRNNETRAVEYAIWRLVQQVSVDGNCKKLSKEDIAVLKRQVDPIECYLGYYFAYRQHKDLNDIQSEEEDKKEAELLKARVPRQLITLLSLE